MFKKSIVFILAILMTMTLSVASAKTTKYTPTKVYDLEHHFYLPALIEYLSTRNEYPNYNKETGILTYHEGAYLPYSSPTFFDKSITMLDIIRDLGATRIKAMNDAGVTTAFVSSSPLIETLPKEEAVKYARMTNDYIAEMCKKYPGRYAGTITLPTPYVEESIAELRRAVNELGLQYVHTHSNYGNENDNLSNDKYIPLLAECEKLNVAIYLHPHNPTCKYITEYGIMFSSAGFGFGVDTMRTSLKMILNGRFDQFPKLKLILGHMAEFYPYILDRLDNRFIEAPSGKFKLPEVKCAHDFSYYFKNKNIFMTTSGIYDPNVVVFAIKEIGIDNILFGTDFPYEEYKASVDFVKNLPISNEDKDKIFYKNVEKYIMRK